MNTTRIKILAVTLLLAKAAQAQSSLLNYEHRVVRAAEQIARIRADSDYAEEGLPYIKRLVPKTEDVQTPEGLLKVDNTWLWTILDSYSKETDRQQRLARLNEAEGRLKALDDHLKRGQAKPSEQRDQAADKEKIREILSRPEYREKEDTFIGRTIKKGIAKAREVLMRVFESFSGLLARIFGASRSGGLFSSVLLLILLIGALFLAAWMISHIKPPKRRSKKRVILGEEVEADATPRDLADAAIAAAARGDFRSAIRKLYVSLLYELADRQILELEDSATNHEYLAKVAGHLPVFTPMRYLTDRFDFVWYGMFPSSEEDFSSCLDRYREAMQGAQALASLSRS